MLVTAMPAVTVKTGVIEVASLEIHESSGNPLFVL